MRTAFHFSFVLKTIAIGFSAAIAFGTLGEAEVKAENQQTGSSECAKAKQEVATLSAKYKQVSNAWGACEVFGFNRKPGKSCGEAYDPSSVGLALEQARANASRLCKN